MSRACNFVTVRLTVRVNDRKFENLVFDGQQCIARSAIEEGGYKVQE